MKLEEEPCIKLTQENSIEFQVQSIYLIYARLLVYAILILVYSKEYILHAIDIWDDIIVPELSIVFYMICYHVIVCDNYV